MINVTMWLWGRGSTLLRVTGFRGVGTTRRGALERGIPALKRDTLYGQKSAPNPVVHASSLPHAPQGHPGMRGCRGDLSGVAPQDARIPTASRRKAIVYQPSVPRITSSPVPVGI
jgi:hypothetical protein